MAHPCCLCGSECYCHGDIDDSIVSKTPKKCDSCGCIDDQSDDDSDDEPEYYYCIGCNWTGDVDPQICPRCNAYSIEGMY